MALFLVDIDDPRQTTLVEMRTRVTITFFPFFFFSLQVFRISYILSAIFDGLGLGEDLVMDGIKLKKILGMLTIFFQTICLGLEPRSTPYLPSSHIFLIDGWMVGGLGDCPVM
jgi:hypothetical protein